MLPGYEWLGDALARKGRSWSPRLRTVRVLAFWLAVAALMAIAAIIALSTL